MLSRVGRWFLDLFYPPRCVACGVNGKWWCSNCRSAVERLPQHPCAKCLAVGEHACSGTLPFAGVIATGFYHSLPLRRLIAGLKYDGVTAVAADVEAYLKETRPESLPWANEKELVTIALPLADRRERERGFNQAHWVAERLHQAWGTPRPQEGLLIRQKGGVSAQADLAHDSALRQANIRGQFQVVRPVPHPVLLVDDVTTTGSTAAEAAKAFLDAGCPSVYLIVLALGK